MNYKNISSSNLTNITIIDNLPNYITCEPNSVSNGGSYNNGEITWNLGSLPEGMQGGVRFKAKVNANTPVGTTIKNNATIVCTGEATVISNYAKTVIVISSRAPNITHTPIKFWGTPNTGIEIKAVIIDDVQVAGATLYYRKKEKPETSWSSRLMTNTTGNTYAGSIHTDSETKGVEYYIEAKDNTANIAATTVSFISVGYPVLLVHGLNGNAAGTWQKEGDGKCNFVKKLGEFANVFTIDLEPSNFDIKVLAGDLLSKINSIKRQTNAPKVDVVGYSMGGLVARWYAKYLNSNNSVRKLIMIGTPNHGAFLYTVLYEGLHATESILDPLQIFRDHTPPVETIVRSYIGVPGEAGLQMLPISPFLYQLNYGSVSNLLRQEDILAPNIDHCTIAGTIIDPRLAGILPVSRLVKTDGVVRVESVKLDNVKNIEVPYNHLNITESEDVCGIVSSILKGISLPQQAPLRASAPEGTPTSVQHMPIIYGTISQSGTKSYNIPVDSTIDEISFLLGWEGGDIGLTLTAADGTLITPTYSTESVSYFNDTQISVAEYTVKNPAAGTWTVNVNANNVSGVGTYSVEILAESTLICSLATDKGVYDPNQTIHITAMLANNNIPLTGASVTARVITPATIEEILLYDDGTHGDTQLNDGTYTNTYTNTNVSGNYCIIATAIGSINNQPFVRQVNTIIYVEQFPDLTIATSSITFSNNTPITGEQVTINAAVKNIGDIGATNTTVFFYDRLPLEEGILIGSKTVSYIPAGGSGDVSMIWTAANGTHTIQVIVSPYNSFLEKSYDNNSASKEIFVNSPDLSSSIPLIPSCPTSGEMATITAVIYNTGTTQADNVLVGFFVGNPLRTGTLIGSQTIAAIPANGSKTVQLVWNTSGYSGIIAIYVQIDPQNEILEANEDNNLSYKEMYIQEVDTTSPTVEISSPANNLTVSGVVNVSAAASDNVVITKVEFYIDGILKYTGITAPYSYSWDTAANGDGSHTIKIIAYDPSNLMGTKSIMVIVDNAAPIDTTKPIFSTVITPNPACAGNINIVVSADEQLISVPTVIVTDSNGGIIPVELVLNANPVFKYQATVTTDTAQGTATIKVSGMDMSSNFGSSTTAFQVKTIEIPLAPAVGTLSVISYPTGAIILINGMNKGITPAELSLQPDSCTLTLMLENFQTYTTTCTISTGSTTYIHATLTTLTTTVQLKITPAAQNVAKGEEFMVDVEVLDVKDMITTQNAHEL
ncbi:MAG: CARDB domain-containing protein [bacterium]|nr:CARDB domain-containing protein [bacterium]